MRSVLDTKFYTKYSDMHAYMHTYIHTYISKFITHNTVKQSIRGLRRGNDIEYMYNICSIDVKNMFYVFFYKS